MADTLSRNTGRTAPEGMTMADDKRYIVCFESDNACWPMGFDEDCPGALCTMHDGRVALFRGKSAARKAIRISSAYARLCREQGRPVNEDFLSGIASVKIMEAVDG